MFSDDQLDELEYLAEINQIRFKRMQSDFSLRRGLQQAQAGFIEGLTTFDLIPKEPRNTGEAIFRQLGHLAGFAPAIMKAPLSLLRKPFGNTGFYKAIQSGIDTLDAMAVPMIASRGTKKLMDVSLNKSKLETLDFLRKGAKTRAITEEALGLGVASAVSSVWKGKDIMADAFVGGAIAGGAFGGIGNFVSVGKLYKGTPAQIDTANKRLRAGVASMFMGIPSTLRGDPTEMQIYEYLLGGFFGYNTRPAHEAAAGKWLLGEKQGEGRFSRDIRDIVDPELARDFKYLSKKTRKYIIEEHPMPSFKNSEGLKGSTGSALGYLEHHFPEYKWRDRAVDYYNKTEKSFKEQDIHSYYRKKARDTIDTRLIERIQDAISNSEALYNSQQSDFTDDVVLKRNRVNQLSERMYNDIEKDIFTNIKSFTDAVEGARSASLGKKGQDPQVEVFIERMKNILGDKVFKKHERKLRQHWHSDVEPLQKVHYIKLSKRNGKTYATVETADNQQVGAVSIGERYHKLPLEYIGYGKGFRFLTHGIDENGKPFKILKNRIDGSNVKFELSPARLKLVQNALNESGKYIYSGVKDKDFLMTANYADSLGNIQLTKEMIFEALSQGDNVKLLAIRKSYEHSERVEKSVFGENSNHERKWISNVMHHAANNKLVDPNAPNLNQLHRLLGKGYGKSVADFNKRMQLLSNRMTPLSPLSFKKTNPDGLMRVVIIKDINTTAPKHQEKESSDTDGGIIIRKAFYDAGAHAIGLDPKSGHYKPVLVGATNLGTFATKSNGQRANEVWDKFMEANNVDFLVFDSSAKLRGEHQTSDIGYKKGWYETTGGTKKPQIELFNRDPLKIYEFPIDNLQLSTGTFENVVKAIKGEEIPIQLYGQSNEIQAPEFAKEYFKEVIEPSLAGSARGRELVRAFEKTEGKDVKGFIKLMNEHDLGVMEIPFEFVRDYVLKNKEPKITRLFMDKLNKLDKEGFFDMDFEFDANADYKQFHATNKLLSEAMRDTYLVRNVLFKDNWHNAYKKYLVRRFSNPYIEHGGKSWLKAFTPDQMMYVDIDPKKKTRNLREGEVYLDEAFRNMPINNRYIPEKDLINILFEKGIDVKQTNLDIRNEPVTLGEAWVQYRKSHNKGMSKPDVAKWNTTFNLLAIRTPADSMSGTRVLRFRGFTGQRGAGSFTHHKDNVYLGGADKDSDSIKIFQGFSNKLTKKFKDVASERAHLKGEYRDRLEKEFTDPNISENEIQRYKGYKLQEGDKGYKEGNDIYFRSFLFSPAYRHKVAEGSNKGKGGLGYGLSAKIVMQNWIDYVKLNGGNYSFSFKGVNGKEYEATVSLKDGLVNGQTRDQYFRDLGTLIVNKSADASNDPTVIDYPNFRRMLFDSAFKTEVYSKTTGEKVMGSNLDGDRYFGYKEINEWGNKSHLAAIRDAINVAKPLSTPKSLSIKKIKDFIYKTDTFGKKTLKNKFFVPLDFIDSIGLEIGETANTSINDVRYRVTRDRNSKENAVYRISDLYVKDSMSLHDMAHTINWVKSKIHGDKALKTVIPSLVNKMYDMGINLNNLRFPDIIESHKTIKERLPIEISRTGALKSYSEKEISQFVEKHLGILIDNMLINSQGYISNLAAVNNFNRVLDSIGKTYGQLGTIELLHKHFIRIHKELADKNIKGDITSKLIPEVVERQNKIKAFMRNRPESKEEADGRIVELEAKIERANKDLSDLAVKNGISPKPLLDYFHALLLSPITGYRQKNVKADLPEVNHNKTIHGSSNIPFEAKREYYQKMEEMYDRALTKDIQLKVDPIKISERRNPESKIVEYENKKILHLINKIKNVDMKKLDAAIEWEQGEIGGRKEPRLTAYYGDKGTDYSYSGKEPIPPKPWIPEILAIKRQIEDITGVKFNSVLVNKYRNEKDSIGRHADNEPELGTNPIIASVSFGAEVPFNLHSIKKGGRDYRINLKENDLLIMQGETQEQFLHSVPKATEGRKPRINLTFRRTSMKESKPEDRVKIKLDVEKRRNEPVLETINEVIDSDALNLLALNDHMVKGVKEFRKNMEDHRVLSENFNEWFKYFTSILSGGGVPRSADTITFDDVMAINKYIEGIRDPYGLKFKLKYWHLDPRFVDEKLSSKGMFKPYYAYHGLVKTSKGLEWQPVYHFTSPIGSIGKYWQRAEMHITKDKNFSQKFLDPVTNYLNNFSAKEQHRLFKELFRYREEGYRPTDVKELKKLEGLDKHVTKFFEHVGDKFIYTKDRYQNKVSDNQGKWELDSDFDGWYKKTGGVLNKYMRWNKDGQFDHKHFRLNVIEKNLESPEIINLIGTEGFKRYQFEYKLEKLIQGKKNIKDLKDFRLKNRKNYQSIGKFEYSEYMPHMNFGYNKGARREIKEWIQTETERRIAEDVANGVKEEVAIENAQKWQYKMENKAMEQGDSLSLKDILLADFSKITEKDLEVTVDEQGSMPAPLRDRAFNMVGYDKRPVLLTDYMDKIIRGYYKNATAIKGQYEIDNMLHGMSKSYKVSKAEKLKLHGSVYKSYPEVWADYIRLYMQSILGHQSYFNTRMTEGIDPLKLRDRKNLFYLTSDESMVRGYEYLYERKGWKPPFIKNAPVDKEARIEYFSRKIHEFGRMEAQYQLMSLLANTGTWATNIFSGNAMTAGSAGVRNFFRSFSDKQIYKRLLSDADGKPVIKLNNGKYAKTKKELLQYLEERGVIDNFIQNEFEVNTDLTSGLKKAGVNIKDIQRDITKAMKSGRGKGEETVLEVIDRYGVKDLMIKYGSFFMQHSEKVNRLNAFTAHAIQTINRYGVEGRELSIKDDFVFDMAMRGIENTQFLYQNSARPAFMRTAMGKVLSRFKLFVWNSIRVRKEFYRQAKLYGFRKGTPEYERFKDIYTIDMFMFAMGSAFMFSIFDTALAPPLDTIQSIADSLYGDKRERDMAFFGSKLGALNLLKPPIARIPDAAWELLTGDWEKFSSYTAYTMFPFGRGIRQIKQLVESPERVGEITLRLPVNAARSRLRRAERRGLQQEQIEEMLGES